MLTLFIHRTTERAPASDVHGRLEDGTAQETVPKGTTNPQGLRVRDEMEKSNWQTYGREANSKKSNGHDHQKFRD